MLALISAADDFEAQARVGLAQAQEFAHRGLAPGGDPKGALREILLLSFSPERASLEALAAERAHFKATASRNDRAKRQMERRRREAGVPRAFGALLGDLAPRAASRAEAQEAMAAQGAEGAQARPLFAPLEGPEELSLDELLGEGRVE